MSPFTSPARSVTAAGASSLIETYAAIAASTARQVALAAAKGGYADGRHNFGYWSRCVPDAFDFVAGALRA